MKLSASIIFGVATLTKCAMGAWGGNSFKPNNMEVYYASTLKNAKPVHHEHFSDSKPTSIKLNRGGLHFKGYGEELSFKWEDLLEIEVEKNNDGTHTNDLTVRGMSFETHDVEYVRLQFTLGLDKSIWFNRPSEAVKFEECFRSYRQKTKSSLPKMTGNEFDDILNKHLSAADKGMNLITHDKKMKEHMARLSNQKVLKYTAEDAKLWANGNVTSYKKVEFRMDYPTLTLELRENGTEIRSFDMNTAHCFMDPKGVPDYKDQLQVTMKGFELSRMGMTLPLVLTFKTKSWRGFSDLSMECMRRRKAPLDLKFLEPQFSKAEKQIETDDKEVVDVRQAPSGAQWVNMID